MKRAFRFFRKHAGRVGTSDLLRYIGPGFIVTIGFIDPGNWAANVAAGSRYGSSLLWVTALSTLMLVVLQHNAAHLGIVTGLCISEAMAKYFRRGISSVVIASAMAAIVATALAEILGAAIGLQMLTGLPLPAGALLAAAFSLFMILTNSYRKIERWIIGFVSLIGLAFLYELALCDVGWGAAARGAAVPSLPAGAMPIVMSILGAVVMPHNLFLHSEVIQSRHLDRTKGRAIGRHLKFEILDTLLAMGTGWAINSAMIIVAAAVFFAHGISVTELAQAEATLRPLLGGNAATIFAAALVCAGIASSVTAGLAGGSVFSGLFQEPFHIDDSHSKAGVAIALAGGLVAALLIGDPFQGLIWSQVALSIQLPMTIVALIVLTSSQAVMGAHANSKLDRVFLWSVAAIVLAFNAALLVNFFWS